MRIRSIAGVGLCLAALACAGTPVPTSPTLTPQAGATGATGAAQTPEASAARHSHNGGSGGTGPACLVSRPCRLIGEVRLVGPKGTFVGTYSPFTTLGAQTLSDIYDFALLARVSGTGRLGGIQPPPMISLQVTANLATATIQMSAIKSKDRDSIATATAKPLFTLLRDPACILTGLRLETRMVVTLEHLGKTEITDSHCTLA